MSRPVLGLPDLEEKLAAAGVDMVKFAQNCHAAFLGQSGQNLMRALLTVCHPLYPPVGPTPESTARRIGQQEVVNLLLRYSGHLSPNLNPAQQ